MTEQDSRFGSIALVGRPNAGKSTLLNALLGRKTAIVSNKPQTTRVVLRGVLTEGSRQALLLDTPGFHKPLHRMNREMVRMAEETLRRGDVVALVVDAATRFGSGDAYLLQRAGRTQTPKLVILNKVDLVAKPALLPMIERYAAAEGVREVVPISALRGDGLQELRQVMLSMLPPGEPVFDDQIEPEFRQRFEVAERIREQVLALTRDELAYTTAVRVESLEPVAGRDLIRIHATIIAERPNQRKILLGRNGSMIRDIGTASRLELERLLGSRVYLDLHVRVEPGWREKDRVLSTLGPDLD